MADETHYPDGSAARTVYGNNLMNDYYKMYDAGTPTLFRVDDLDLIAGTSVPERATKDGLYSTGSGLSLQYLWREKYLHGDSAGNIKMDNFYNPSQLLFGKASRSFQVSAEYDREGRITDTDYQWTSQSTPFAQYDYQYDRAGNRSAMEVAERVAGETVTDDYHYYYSGLNRLELEDRAGAFRDYDYDEQGNMTSNPEYEYSYDHFGRLVQVDRGAIKFIYSLSGDKLLKIGPGNIVTAYFYGGGSEVLYEAGYKDTGTELELIGSDYYLYSDTGLVAHFSGTPSGAPGFVSRFYDSDVGLYQLGARWYDPNIGRFVSPDPIPSSLNQYAYARNNPFRYQDRSGLISEFAGGLLYNAMYYSSEQGSYPRYLIDTEGFADLFGNAERYEAAHLSTFTKYLHSKTSNRINAYRRTERGIGGTFGAIASRERRKWEAIDSFIPASDTNLLAEALLWHGLSRLSIAQSAINSTLSTAGEGPAAGGMTIGPAADTFLKRASGAASESGYFDVAIHGDDLARLGPSKVSNMIRAFPEYQAGQPVRLLSCSAANTCVPQGVANNLGVTVQAPNDFIWFDIRNNWNIGPFEESTSGRFVYFFPD